MADTEDSGPGNFIRELIEADLAEGRYQRVCTRFPPEPNGRLHIGHAKAICVNFGMAAEFGGTCNLRFDDTNPTTEETEYVDAIKEDVRWLGFEWDGEHFASDYFHQLYDWAVELVKKGLAYVDSQTTEQIRENRGNFYNKGKNSPYRDRSVEENLELLERMKAGELEEGACVLRAKIDMESTNLNLRDPPIYRIKKAHHHRTGDEWCIYPIYDYAHPLSDAIEEITHSICTLEFEDHRPLYDWCVANVDTRGKPRQIEFARLGLTYTVMSKRRLLQLVQQGHVAGWDDPRMPTLSGMRRRGITPEAIVRFCDRIGVAKRDSMVDMGLLEFAVREHLNEITPRVMGVLRPLEIVIDNFPEGHTEWFDAPLHPEDPSHGTRKVPLTKRVYIERDDFREDAPKKWYRFAPGREVRLRYACLVTVVDVVKNDAGEVVQLRCTWDPESKGGTSPDGRKVRGTSHWVSAEHGVQAEVRLYDRLFSVENPMEGEGDFLSTLNPDSLEILKDCVVEPHLADAAAGTRVQFERVGYFCVDPDSKPGALVFNRTITLRDSWAKIEQKLAGG